MSIKLNPFTPNYGEIPLHMAGRDDILDNTLEAFEMSSRSPELSSLISGARGTGKTALLALIAEEVQKRGWISVSVNCAPGMLEDIYEQTIHQGKNFVEKAPARHLSGVSVGNVVGLSWVNEQEQWGNWRTRMTRLLEQLEEANIGLLITVDEVDPSVDEMVQLVSTYQLFVRERRRVALLMAGLPHMVSMLVQQKSITFLRRAKRQRLERIPDAQIMEALQKTVADGGKQITTEALDEATKAIGGFAFMLQLVGFYLWRASGDEPLITVAHVQKAIQIANKEMDDSVLEPTYAMLSNGDLSFCNAMLCDEDESSISDIIKRLDRPKETVNTYRVRLIEQGVIGSPRRGIVRFELPFFKEYLKKRNGTII